MYFFFSALHQNFVMGKSVFYFAVFLFQTVMAQKTVVESSASRADLAVTELRVIEATRNPSTGLHKIKVSVTIKNNGDKPSIGTSLKAMIQNHVLNLVAPPNPQPKNPWYQLGDMQPVNPVPPGQSITSEHLFTEVKKIITTDRFQMGVMADAGNKLKEINETDNNSAIVNVTPVDKVEYIAVQPTIPVGSQQLIKVDTFQYTIGRADFHLQSRAATSTDLQNFFQTFIEMNPHGITIKKFGGEAIVKNVTLIAPLQLPSDAVIRKIKFNYIKLPGTDLVPHLVLRSNHLTTGNEGWGSNTPVTSYWVTSDTRDGREGYKVKSSITNSGFNVAISKGSTYYFEILGADARSTTTPMTSDWPTTDKIFIWSIQVFYTIK